MNLNIVDTDHLRASVDRAPSLDVGRRFLIEGKRASKLDLDPFCRPWADLDIMIHLDHLDQCQVHLVPADT